VALFDRLVVVSVVLAVVLIPLTLWVSPHRRRTLLQLAVGIALGVVLIRRIGLRAEDEVVDLAQPENQEAVAVVVGTFVDSLFDATVWILAAAALVAVVALVTGPYRWAVALRRRTVSAARALAAGVSAVIARRDDDASREARGGALEHWRPFLGPVLSQSYAKSTLDQVSPARLAARL
jgi:hypothetical protein